MAIQRKFPASGWLHARTARKTPRNPRGAVAERIERRLLLSAVSWSNSAGGLWNDPSNWSNNAVPTASDDVTINVAGNPTIILTGTQAAQSITNSDTLWINGNATGGSANLTLGGAFTNSGTIRIESSDQAFTSRIVMGPGQTLVNTGAIQANKGTNGLNQISGNLLNQGTITAADDATLSLDVTSATFTQQSGSIKTGGGVNVTNGSMEWFGGAITGMPTLANVALDFPASASGSGMVILGGTASSLSGTSVAGQGVWVQGNGLSGNAQASVTDTFTNGGTLQLGSADGGYASQLVVAAGKTLTNSGTLRVVVGASGPNGIAGSFTNAGTLTIDDSALLTLSPGAGTFTQQAGSIVGGGELIVSGGSMEWSGGTIATAPKLANVALDFPPSADGSGMVILGGTASSLSGTSGAGQGVWVQGNGLSGNAQVSVTDAFTNGGTLQIGSADGGYASQVIVAAGKTLANTGTVHVVVGASGPNGIGGSFKNTGTITLDDAASITLSPGAGIFTQQAGSIVGGDGLIVSGGSMEWSGGTITGIPDLGDVALDLSGSGAGTVALSGSASAALSGASIVGETVWIQGNGRVGNTSVSVPGGFTNGGTLRIESADGGYMSRLVVAANQQLTNTGTIQANLGAAGPNLINGNVTNKGDVKVADNAVLSMDATNATFTQQSGSITSGGGLYISNGSMELAGGTIAGLPKLGNVALDFPSGANSAGAIAIGGNSSSLSGTSPSGQTVWVQGNAFASHAQVAVPGAFTNGGTLKFGSADGGYISQLNVAAGKTLVNTGTIQAVLGAGGLNKITGSITNQGAIAVDADANISVDSGTGTFTQQSGTITAGGGLFISNGSMEWAGGAITGIPRLAAVALDFPAQASGSGALSLAGASALSGASASGQAVWVQGNSFGSHATVSVPSGFTNGGTLQLGSADGGYMSQINIAAGQTLVNNGTVESVLGAGGPNSINGSITNKGAFTVDANASLTVDSGAGTFTQQAGTLSAGGGLFIEHGAFDWTGGTPSGPPELGNLALDITATSPGIVALSGTSSLTGASTAGQTVWIQGDTFGSHAQVAAPAGFANAGTMQFGSADGGYISQLNIPAGQSLTNTGTIQAVPGLGGFNEVNGNLSNQGLVDVAASAALTLTQVANYADATNTLSGGAWTIHASGSLVFPSGAVVDVNVAAITLDGAGATFPAISTLSSITGSLTLTGSPGPSLTPAGGTLSNSGVISIDAVSALNVNGAYAQSSGGKLVAELSSPSVGHLAATGAIALAGTLNTPLASGYDPAWKTILTVVSGLSRTGTFDTFGGGATPSKRLLNAQYTDTSGQVEIGPLPSGLGILAAASDSGISDSDGITNVTTPVFSGSAVEGTRILMFVDNVQVADGPITAGAWSITAPVLSDGTHSIAFEATDADGDQSLLTSSPDITIDTVAPAAVPPAPILEAASDSGVSNSDNITNVKTPTFDISGGGPYLFVYQDGSRTGGYISASTFQTSSLADGMHTLAAAAVDAAGNATAQGSAVTVTIDTVPPAVPPVPVLEAASDSGASNSDRITNVKTPTFDISGGGPYVFIYQDGSQTGGYVSASTFQTSSLADGTHTLAAKSVDAAGNASAQGVPISFIIDATPPASAVTALPAQEASNVFTVNWSGQDGAGSGIATYDVFVSDNGGAFTLFQHNTAATSAQFTGLYNHTYGFYSLATDVAGNVESGKSSSDTSTSVISPLPAWATLGAGGAATYDPTSHTLMVTAGIVNVTDPSAGGPDQTSAANIIVNGSSSHVNFTTSEHLESLTLTGGATATMTSVSIGNTVRAAGTEHVLVIASGGTVSIDGTSKLDLADNDMIVKGGNAGTLESLLQGGRGGATGGAADGSWNGTHGIGSSAAQARDTANGFETTALGIAVNSDLITGALSSFDGEAVSASDVLIKYTYNGDANLNGVVDDNDVTAVGLYYDGGVSTSLYWANGDFNGDGKVDDTDVSILGLVYGNGDGAIL